MPDAGTEAQRDAPASPGAASPAAERHPSRVVRGVLVMSCVALTSAVATLEGCAHRYDMAAVTRPAACRAVAPLTAAAMAVPAPLLWMGPAAEAERRTLERWCGGVGPPLVVPARAAADGAGADERAVDRIAIVSWNVHVGAGDVLALVERLETGVYSGGRPVRHYVLLLQEAYRSGAGVPGGDLRDAIVASAIRPRGERGAGRQEIGALAARLGVSAYYVPSMRNGPPLVTDEDRGNAILSTLPLHDLRAIELPFERQRRVALAATVRGTTGAGQPWEATVASVHLDNLAAAEHGWLLTGPARRRQVRGLLRALPSDAPAMVVGGDLNTWFGFHDPAFAELAASFPQTPTTDRRPTFAGLLRLDHLAFRLPAGWRGTASRLDDRFGSDHHPLLGWLDVGDSAGPGATRSAPRETGAAGPQHQVVRRPN